MTGAAAEAMRGVVGLQPLPDYEPAAVVEAMRRCLAPLGGMAAFVRPGQRVLLKPNLLAGFPPHKAVTTHPAVVRAAILLAQEAGGSVQVGDSPAVGGLPAVLQVTGLAAVLRETGAAAADCSTPRDYPVPRYRVAPRLTLARAVGDADVLITLPKLKTHGQMVMTGALKNQYGLVPGALKSQWHFRLQQREWLAALLLDIHRTARPALAILDAVVAMEGNGPSGGRPRPVGALLAGADLAAVDTLACLLINLEPRFVPLLEAARNQGLGATSAGELDVRGADWRLLRVADFEKISRLEDVLRIVPLPRPVLGWIRGQCTALPRVLPSRCRECGVCEEGCPVTPAAIRTGAGPAEVDAARCIRCYCCQEMCPHHAIELRRPTLLRHLRVDPLAERVGNLLARLWPTARPPDPSPQQGPPGDVGQPEPRKPR